MRLLLILILCAILNGCSTMDIAKSVASSALGVDGQSGIAVDTQFGDKTANVGTNDNSQVNLDDIDGTVTITSTKSDKVFETTDQVTINEGPNMWYLLILILGWLLPSPNQMYSEVKSWFTKPT